ncbi:MAG: FAD:protein FMN transferase [Hydrogenophilales bacterium]|nr:FAD:protein FMN transferase [Hydrogenophilales bacterium]
MNARAQRAQPWLGTLVEIAAEEADMIRLNTAIEHAFARIAAIHGAMSFHDADSELSRVNRHAVRDWVALSDDLAHVFAAALEFAAASDGLFDPSVAPWLVETGHLPRHPDMPADAAPDWQAIDLDGDRVRFARPLLVDFGGIAKGYAVDAALAVLREAGMASARVNAGGDLARFGGSAEPIRVRHPAQPTLSLPLADLQHGAAATSAGYYQPETAASPLRHPHTGGELCRTLSVSVLAPTCLAADALTKIVAADPQRAPALLGQRGAQAILIDPSGSGITLGDAAGWRPLPCKATV